MITRNNGVKQIQYTLSDVVYDITTLTKCGVYVPELPRVACSDEKDAEYIQREVNNLVSKLAKEIGGSHGN